MARSELYFTTLPAPLAERVERVRGAGRLGAGRHGAQIPQAAALRALIAMGLDAIEAAPAPPVAPPAHGAPA